MVGMGLNGAGGMPDSSDLSSERTSPEETASADR